MAPKKTIKKNVNKRHATGNSKTNVLYIIPVIVAIAVVPLIVYLKIYPPQGIQRDLLNGPNKAFDLFSYYKYIVLIFTAVAGVFLLSIKKMNNSLIIKRTYAYVPLAVYTLFVIISTIFSKYMDVATSGLSNRHEGAYTLLVYVALAILTLNLVETEGHIRLIVNALLISSAIIGLIGLSQLLGHDFFTTSIGRHLILTPEYQNSPDALKLRFGTMVYSTLFNPNYVGSYTALVLPVCIGFIIYEKRKVLKILSGLLVCILFLCLLGSQSAAGLAGIVIALLLLLLMLRKTIIRYIKPISIVCVSALILLIGVNFATGGSLSHRISSGLINIIGNKPTAGTVYMKDIIIKGNTIKFLTDKQSMTAKYVNGSISFYDSSDKLLNGKQEQKVITFTDPAYSMYKFQIFDQGRIGCFVGDKQFLISLSKDNFKLVGLRDKLIDVLHPEKIGFDQQESALSGRGFIWSRTIPLLKDTIFIGHGPDTFAIYFPQNDIIGKLNAYGVSTIIVDKPHNLYLQMAVNTGIISVLAFIALLIFYAVSSFKLYFKKNLTGYIDYIGVGIFCGVCGYCVTSLANDSVISVAPVFWILLGLGLACNLSYKKMHDR